METNQKKDIDMYIVDTFKDLIGLILTLLGLFLLTLGPVILIMTGVVYLISKEWLVGLGSLVLAVISFYTARGLSALIKK